MKTIKMLITNQKGGVGKSTIAANLAAYFSLIQGVRTAFIDFDKQSSSSNWLKKSSDNRIAVYQEHLPNELNSGLVLLEAKAALRRSSKDVELLIADLTWTHSLPLQFLLEFDMVIVPSSISRVEMASSEIFVLEYLQKVLALSRTNRQSIIMVPSRIEHHQNTHSLFPFVTELVNCFVSPPVLKVDDIDEYYCNTFLCKSENEMVARNFCEFGDYIHAKYRLKANNGTGDHIDSIGRLETPFGHKMDIPITAARGVPMSTTALIQHPKNQKKVQKVVDLFIPKFLRSSRAVDGGEG